MSNQDDIARQIAAEYYEATGLFPPFNSAHEGWAVIKEELDELWEEVRNNKRPTNDYIKAMRKEAIQVGAMALRFAHDVCDHEHIIIGGDPDHQPADHQPANWQCAVCGEHYLP